MNRVFERYVTVALIGVAHQFPNTSVIPQRPAAFWTTNRLVPDILVRRSKEMTAAPGNLFILDAKWKREDYAPSEADLRQIFAYNHQFGASAGYLLNLV